MQTRTILRQVIPESHGERPVRLAGTVAEQPRFAQLGARIDPVTLRLFVAVMNCGTIVGAAEREHTVPSAVSKRLSDLEAFLGTPLLARSNRGIGATPAGNELLGLARSVLSDLDNIYYRLKEHAHGARGLVRVLANISSIAGFLPDSMRSFMGRHPRVDVQLEERISDAVTQGVASNAADVGLCVYDCNHIDGIVALPYRRDELVVMAPTHHPLAQRSAVEIAETLAFDYVGLHTGSHINQMLLKAAIAHGVGLRCRMQVTSFDTLSLMVEAGMGLALIPRGIGERYTRHAQVRVLTLSEPWAHREIRIFVRSIDGLPAAARLFVDHLRNEANGIVSASLSPVSQFAMAAS